MLSAHVYSPFTSYQTLYYISNLCGFLKILEKKNYVIRPAVGALPIKYKW